LPGTYANSVSEFLNEGRTFAKALSDTNGMVSPPPSDTEPDTSTLAFQISGRVQPLITMPDDTRLGISPQSGEFFDPNFAGILIQPNYSSLTISRPAEGDYQLEWTGDAGEILNLGILFSSGDQEGSSSGGRLIGRVGIMKAVVHLDRNAENPVQLIEPVNRVQILKADPVEGKVRLFWDAPQDNRIVGYRIYGKRDGYRLYELLGQTATTEYLPGHDWYNEGTTDLWQYFVVAVDALDNEGFVEGSATNDHPCWPALRQIPQVDGRFRPFPSVTYRQEIQTHGNGILMPTG
jgi:hypothetical protein